MNQILPQKTIDAKSTLEMCRVLMNNGQHKNALTLLTLLVDHLPENRDLLTLVSDCYWEMRRSNQSLNVLQLLLEQNPHDVALLARLGSRMLSLGKKEAAVQAFEAALELQPDNINLICAMDLVSPLDPSDPRAKRLKRAVRLRNTPSEDRESAFNTLGRMAERSGDFPAAFKYFQSSKNSRPGRYDSAKLEASVDTQLEVFTRDNLQALSFPPQKIRALFVTGTPRSGTTLVESMLSTHPDVGSVGESSSLQRAKETVKAECGCDEPDWKWCENLSQHHRDTGRALYLKGICQSFDEPKPWIIDKMPGNIFDLGFAAQAMPEACFIYMKRHPLDIAVSLMTNNLVGSATCFSKKQRWIAHYILQSERSAEDFQKKLGDRFRMQSYRALVEDTPSQMKEILAFMGLPWTDDVLHPENSPLTIRTASVLQVREGVNLKGLERWKNYEAQLQPLIKALGGWDWIHEWERRDLRLWVG